MLDNLPTTYVAMQKALVEIPDERAQEIPGLVTGWLTATKLSGPEEQELLKQAGKRFGGKPALQIMILEARRAARIPGAPEEGEADSEVAILLALVHEQEPLLFHHEDRGYSGDRKVREPCRCQFRVVPWRTFCPFSIFVVRGRKRTRIAGLFLRRSCRRIWS
jgi:hypothetical protein